MIARRLLRFSPAAPGLGAGDPAQAGTLSENNVIRPDPPDIGAWQATNEVISLADTNTLGTLRYAMNNVATLEGDILFGVDGTITLTSPLPQITGDVTIARCCAAEDAVSGNNLYQVFNVASGGTASISGLTIENGVAFFGAGINNAGTLSLNDDAISDNTSTGGGGAGIYNYGNSVYSATLIVNG